MARTAAVPCGEAFPTEGSSLGCGRRTSSCVTAIRVWEGAALGHLVALCVTHGGGPRWTQTGTVSEVGCASARGGHVGRLLCLCRCSRCTGCGLGSDRQRRRHKHGGSVRVAASPARALPTVSLPHGPSLDTEAQGASSTCSPALSPSSRPDVPLVPGGQGRLPGNSVLRPLSSPSQLPKHPLL